MAKHSSRPIGGFDALLARLGMASAKLKRARKRAR